MIIKRLIDLFNGYIQTTINFTFRAGYQYNLKPVMAEIYNLGTPHYYVVAVTKQRDNSSELIYLKRKSTCHTAVRIIIFIGMIFHPDAKTFYYISKFQIIF